MVLLRNYIDYKEPYKKVKQDIRNLDHFIRHLMEHDLNNYPIAPSETLYKETLLNLINHLLDLMEIDKEVHSETLKLLSRNISKLYGYDYKHNNESKYILLEKLRERVVNIIWYYTDKETIENMLIAYEKLNSLIDTEIEIEQRKKLDEETIKIVQPKKSVSTSTNDDEDTEEEQPITEDEFNTSNDRGETLEDNNMEDNRSPEENESIDRRPEEEINEQPENELGRQPREEINRVEDSIGSEESIPEEHEEPVLEENNETDESSRGLEEHKEKEKLPKRPPRPVPDFIDDPYTNNIMS